VKESGGKILCGGEVLGGDKHPGGCYVTPAIATAENHWEIVQEETFAPLLYIIGYDKLDDALRLHNDVPQGLSSAIFTRNLLEAERFLGHAGSDCGIANVNIGTSGAEIGGAFGGEKETGGGRERQRFLEGLHAPPDQHDQLQHGTAAGAGDQVVMNWIYYPDAIAGQS
jgi:aldehyde dehydrogenase (NAD+)